MNEKNRQARVLCVDDEPAVVRSLRWLLQDRFEVVTATDASQALELARDSAFDVVISDQRMPMMTGTEFLSRFKTVQPNAVRLMLTGYSDLADMKSSVNESEVYRFINKPWDNQDLIGTVTDAAEIAKMECWSDSGVPNSQFMDTVDEQDNEPRGVLVVDPDPQTQELMRQALGEGSNVFWATTRSEAAVYLDTEKIAVMVCEAVFSSSSAVNFVNRVRRVHPTITPVVYSAAKDTNLMADLINNGQIFRYVSKPAGPGYLRMVMKSSFARHKQMSVHPSMRHRYKVPAITPVAADTSLDTINPEENAQAYRSSSDHVPMPQKPKGWFKRLLG